MNEFRRHSFLAFRSVPHLMSYTKGRFTLDEIEFIQAATVRVLVAAANGSLDLNILAREELTKRGLDSNGIWIGFEKARLQSMVADREDPPVMNG